MNAYLAISLGLLAITFHELGHYEAMRRCGIKIKEVALLGFPVPFLPSFRYKGKETLWSVHPFLLGAYVKPYSGESIQTKNLRDQLYIYGNGIIANLVYAAVLGAIAILISGFESGRIEKATLNFLALMGIAWIIWRARRFIALLLPVLTIPVLLLVGYSFLSSSPSEALNDGTGGPLAVFSFLGSAETLVKAFQFASFLSVNLAIINLAPLPPLDGGSIFAIILKTYLGKKFEKGFNWIAIPVFLALIVYVLGLDVFRIWKWIW